jgi:hypothetical protein
VNVIPSLLTYPARPLNGGHLKNALPKVGEWFYEPKYNGWRAIVDVPTGTMWNRHGKLLTIAGEFSRALAILKSTKFTWLDVEALERRHTLGRGSLIVLDCPGVTAVPYVDRLQSLYDGLVAGGHAECLLQTLKPEDNAVYIPPSYDEGERDELWQQLQDVNKALGCKPGSEFYEGLVAKRADSLYPLQLNSPDQTTSGWMKHRFVL